MRTCIGLALFMPATGDGGTFPTSEFSTRIYVISVGIDRYTGDIHSLQYSAADARALADAIERGAHGIPIDKQVLADAGRQSIEAAFARLIAESRPDDQFVFFFSGQSRQVLDAAGRPTSVLLTASSRLLRDDGSTFATDYTDTITPEILKAWTSRVQARKQLLIFDADGTKDFSASFASRVESEGEQAVKASGRSVMVLGVDGMTREDASLGHGVFTFDILRCLSGAADAFPSDGRITAGELDVCVRGRSLLDRTGSKFLAPPIVSSTRIGRDFCVAWREDLHGARLLAGAEDSRGGHRLAAEPPRTPAHDAPGGKDYALIIATDDYASYKHLPNPINDARTIAADLNDIYGFETRLVKNPSLNDLFTVLTEYIDRKWGPDDQLFIFVAGHGMYIENTREGFLIASDSRPRKEDAFATSLLPLTRLRDIVERIDNRHIFLVIDACFGGTFDQHIADAADRASDDLYAEVSGAEIKTRKLKYRSRRYLTSGGKEYVPDGRPGQHSPFARKLLEALRSHGGKEGYLTIGKILQYVEKVTPEPRTGEFGSQEPGGDFVLVRKSD